MFKEGQNVFVKSINTTAQADLSTSRIKVINSQCQVVKIHSIYGSFLHNGADYFIYLIKDQYGCTSYVAEEDLIEAI